MPPTPPPTATERKDVLTALSTWLGSVLNDVLRAFADVEGASLILAEQGWTGGTPVLPAQLLSRLDQEAQAGSDPAMRAAESFGEVLVAISALGDALIAASGSQAGGVSALELLADYLDFVMSGRALSYVTVDTDYGCGIIRGSDTAPALPSDLVSGWNSVRHDAKAAYRFMIENKGRLLNLLSVEELKERGSKQC